MKALEMGAIETIILWENLDHIRYELKNPITSNEKILTLTPSQATD